MITFLGTVTEPEFFDPTHSKASPDRIAALQWIVEDDPLRLPIPNLTETNEDGPSSWKIRQRYVLALLYFSTNGNQWENDYNFLSTYDECRWTTAWTLPEGERFFTENDTNVKGAVCDQKGSVVRLLMCELREPNRIGFPFSGWFCSLMAHSFN